MNRSPDLLTHWPRKDDAAARSGLRAVVAVDHQSTSAVGAVAHRQQIHRDRPDRAREARVADDIVPARDRPLAAQVLARWVVFADPVAAVADAHADPLPGVGQPLKQAGGAVVAIQTFQGLAPNCGRGRSAPLLTPARPARTGGGSRQGRGAPKGNLDGRGRRPRVRLRDQARRKGAVPKGAKRQLD